MSKEKRPQQQVLEELEAVASALFSSEEGVVVDSKEQSITFYFHKGGSIKDIGLNGCFLSDLFAAPAFMQKKYYQMFPHNENFEIGVHADKAFALRKAQEIRHLAGYPRDPGESSPDMVGPCVPLSRSTRG